MLFSQDVIFLCSLCLEAPVTVSLCTVSMKCGWKPFISCSHFTSQSLPRASRQEPLGKDCEFVTFSVGAALAKLSSVLPCAKSSGSRCKVPPFELEARLEAYSIATTLTGNQGCCIFSSDKSFNVSIFFSEACEIRKNCFGKT